MGGMGREGREGGLGGIHLEWPRLSKKVIVIFFLSIGIFIFFPPSFCHLVPSEYLGLEFL